MSLLASYATRYNIPSMFLSIDIRKAFDTVAWDYLFYTLRFWGFGPSFLTLVQSLYTLPRAQVRYSGFSSQPLSIFRGTRQGCPLSPILFALALEPLAQKIRQHPDISGLTVLRKVHKIGLFADDALLLISNPLISLPNLLECLSAFGDISGLQVNDSKSMALNINLPLHLVSTIQASFPFQWQPVSLPYLGIRLTASPLTLYKANYPPLFSNLLSLLSSWSKLTLSWLGRIEAVRMTLLPKLLYYFRVLPTLVTASSLQPLQRAIFRFIWCGRRARIAASVLLRPKALGGLGVPHLHHYYLSAQLAPLALTHACKEIPHWVTLEEAELRPWSFSNILWSPKGSRPSIPNPITKHSLSLWDAYADSISLRSSNLPLLSFLRNPLFSPALTTPSSFSNWTTQGLTYLGRLQTSGGIKSFTYLRQHYKLPPKEIFRYLQIKHFALASASLPNTDTKYTAFELACRDTPHGPGLISLLYSCFSTRPSPHPHSYTLAWASDLGVTPDADGWNDIWANTRASSRSSSILEINYKVLLRWYMVPTRTFTFSPSHSPLCFRECSALGTYFHTWWTCPVVSRYWTKVFDLLSRLFHRRIPKDPMVALLNSCPEGLSNRHHKLLLQVTAAAKREIAMAWRSPSLSFAKLAPRLDWVMSMEKRTARLTDRLPSFYRTWDPWLSRFPAPHLQ